MFPVTTSSKNGPVSGLSFVIVMGPLSWSRRLSNGSAAAPAAVLIWFAVTMSGTIGVRVASVTVMVAAVI